MEELSDPTLFDLDDVGGFACPIDPMERLQCDSCQ